MSHKRSGLWCDLCGNPILSGDWWHIEITIETDEGLRKVDGHSCQKCKDKREKQTPEADDER